MKMLTVVNRSLQGVTLRPADQAAAELARRYAKIIDTDPDQTASIGPRLLATLNTLMLTPKARAVATRDVDIAFDGEAPKEPTSAEQTSPLDDLRARRRARTGA